jgi:uroporphyrinogen-III synthase
VSREERPLEGLRVLVTRPEHQAGDLSARIRDLGGMPVEAPTIEIRSGDHDALTSALHDLAAGRFTAVCFTSANGVVAFGDALEEAGLGVDVLEAPAVAVLGPGTLRALRRLGASPDIVPPEATTESLGRSLPDGEGEVLLPRADIATTTLPTILRERGYTPVEVDAYVTGRPSELPADVRAWLADGAIEIITFTSASTVHNFVDLVDDWSGTVVSIGPVTSEACREHGIEVAVEADRHDLDGLVDAILRAATIA